MARVVVVGASLAGVRTAEAIRREGFDGELVVVGDEDLAPYDRPPLSKQVLAADWDPERVQLKVTPEVTGALRLATRAESLDLDRRAVTLHTGESLGFDALVIATGARPRRIPGLAGFTLRTYEDALAIRAAAEPGARAVVVGAGFIGAEVASSLATRGVSVTVLEAMPVPMAAAVGDVMGARLAALHAEKGVDLRLGVAARADDPLITGADLVVVGVGVVPAVEWLESSGVMIANGVRCDGHGRVLDGSGEPLDGVVAVGDVANWDHPRWGPMRFEHWTNALEQSGVAAVTVVRGLAGSADGSAGDLGAPSDHIPYFWSDQYGHKIQFVGVAEPGSEVEVVEGDLDAKFVAAYRSPDGRICAALSLDMPHRIMVWRGTVAASGDL